MHAYQQQLDVNYQRVVTDELVQLEGNIGSMAAQNLLISMGVWRPNETGVLRKWRALYRPTIEEKEAMIHVKKRACIDRNAVNRLDLRHLHTFTIDDESTFEVDDALSIEDIDGHKVLWVHIADPTRWLDLNDVLDRNARRRGKSTYLPTGTMTMLPFEIVELLSLESAEDKPALSVGIVQHEDGSIDMRKSVLRPSSVAVDERLTYQVDLPVRILRLQLHAK